MRLSSDQTDAVATRLRAAGCVYAEDEARLVIEAAATTAELEGLIRRRAGGEPLEYVVGWAEFCGLRIAVDPGVFVPRYRTQFLAAQAIELARDAGPAAVLLDLCCGSGAIAAAVRAAVDGVEVHAADIDPAAVACARRNLARATVYLGDLYAPLPSTLRGRVNVLVANVPYVPTTAIALLPAEARLHEATTALDGGADGLAVLRRVVADVASWLTAGGSVLMEVSDEQAKSAAATYALAGLAARVLRAEDVESSVVIGTRLD